MFDFPYPIHTIQRGAVAISQFRNVLLRVKSIPVRVVAPPRHRHTERIVVGQALDGGLGSSARSVGDDRHDVALVVGEGVVGGASSKCFHRS